ncbi:MAG: hypothetical protein JST38_08400 [Bacteroidetes bacterium]|nr:hypothetical protein [Bacteroidota bacterium]
MKKSEEQKADTHATPLPEGFTAERVKELARQHGAVYPVHVRKDGRIFTGLFKKPTLSIMSAAAAMGGDDAIKQGRVMYTNCKLAVDPQVDQDEELLFGMITGVGRLFKVLAAEVGEPFVVEP